MVAPEGRPSVARGGSPWGQARVPQLPRSPGGAAVSTVTETLPAGLNAERAQEIYRVMRTIREFEERLHTEFATEEVPGVVHLYGGQEAVAAGVFAHLRPDDYVSSTHRGHGHAIAKGCDLTGMMLEIYGRSGGLCRGKGGSMHIADFSVGMLGANGVVAAGMPIACGAAHALKLQRKPQVVACFFGDGAINRGPFLEALRGGAELRLNGDRLRACLRPAA